MVVVATSAAKPADALEDLTQEAAVEAGWFLVQAIADHDVAAEHGASFKDLGWIASHRPGFWQAFTLLADGARVGLVRWSEDIGIYLQVATRAGEIDTELHLSMTTTGIEILVAILDALERQPHRRSHDVSQLPAQPLWPGTFPTTKKHLLAAVGQTASDLEKARDAREAAIVAAVAAGLSQRRVAAAAGMSHTGVLKMLRRAK